MPLGSAAKSTIDIDFTRAQGVNSSGHITFEPPRIRVGTTIISPIKVRVPVVNGIASVELVRLPSGTYHVREEIDGRNSFEFNFSLPLGAAASINYEEIAPVDSVPLVYTVIRTINGAAPDPTTGNINIEVSGGPEDLDELTDVVLTSVMNGHVLVYDGTELIWQNRALTADDVGDSATVHTHTVSQITDFESSVDSRVQLIVGAAPEALNTLNEIANALADDADFAGTMTLALAGKQQIDLDLTTIASLNPTDGDVLQRIAGAWANRTTTQLKTSLSLSKEDVGLSSVNNTADVDKPVSTAQAAAIAQRILPPRIIRIKDKTKQGAGDTYNLPNTSNVWALFAVGPAEYTIAASVGDDINLDYDFLMDRHTTSKYDFAVVTGETPTIQRYLSSGSATPSADGVSGNYPSGETFQGQNGMTGFAVESGDLDSGFVRLRWVIKTSLDTGKIYANNNYPLTIRVVNTRLSGI
jgi:hypothetical protein